MDKKKRDFLWQSNMGETHYSFTKRADKRVERESVSYHVSPGGEDFFRDNIFHIKEFINSREKFGREPVRKEAVITYISKVFVRDMRNQTGEEFRTGRVIIS